MAALGRKQTLAGSLRLACSVDEVHEVARCFAFCIGPEYDIEIRGRPEGVQQCPEREALTTVFGQTKVHFHVLYPGVESFRRDFCQI